MNSNVGGRLSDEKMHIGGVIYRPIIPVDGGHVHG